MSIRTNYRHTIAACFIGYVTQAVVNNFAPLLFLTFHAEFGVSLERIALLVSANFGFQLLVDLLSSRYVDKMGYRFSICLAHGACAAGLVGLAFLPSLLPDSFLGLLISVLVYALGGGLLEVLVSPIVEACPTKNKASVMSLLHSFYCWGYVAVVLVSTAFFALFGIRSWRLLAALWALIPLFNMLYFMRVPIATLQPEGEKGLGIGALARMAGFWVVMLMMMCAGACEQGISQWASTFAELGLGVSKTVGDLAGPLSFAFLMGCARALYAGFGERVRLENVMLISGVLCLASYLLASLSHSPALGLMGCGLCGLSVGVLWPGTFSIAARTIPRGGTALFALLALAGDLGCGGGPALVGFVSDAMGGRLKAGILAAVAFPVLLLVALALKRRLVPEAERAGS